MKIKDMIQIKLEITHFFKKVKKFKNHFLDFEQDRILFTEKPSQEIDSNVDNNGLESSSTKDSK